MASGSGQQRRDAAAMSAKEQGTAPSPSVSTELVLGLCLRSDLDGSPFEALRSSLAGCVEIDEAQVEIQPVCEPLHSLSSAGEALEESFGSLDALVFLAIDDGGHPPPAEERSRLIDVLSTWLVERGLPPLVLRTSSTAWIPHLLLRLQESPQILDIPGEVLGQTTNEAAGAARLGLRTKLARAALASLELRSRQNQDLSTPVGEEHREAVPCARSHDGQVTTEEGLVDPRVQRTAPKPLSPGTRNRRVRVLFLLFLITAAAANWSRLGGLAGCGSRSSLGADK